MRVLKATEKLFEAEEARKNKLFAKLVHRVATDDKTLTVDDCFHGLKASGRTVDELRFVVGRINAWAEEQMALAS